MIIQELVFEMQSGMNECDHHIIVLVKQQRQWPEKFGPEWEIEP